MSVRIGTRGSQLALWQANHVKAKLEAAHPGETFELVIIRTTGDADQATPLSQMGGVGLFTKQLEQALDRNEIDLAVHSGKDMPSELADRFRLAAILEREQAMDVLVSDRMGLADLGSGRRIGTGSLRRVSQLKNRFPGIETLDLRGNVDTRLAKLKRGDYDAIVLAYAGLHRLGLDEVIADLIPVDIMVPAAAQGAVAVEVRADDYRTADLASVLNHEETARAVTEERAFLKVVEGGCKVPVGCHGWFDDTGFHLVGYIGSLDGKTAVRHTLDVPAEDWQETGRTLGRAMLEDGGAEILEAIRAAGGERHPTS